jgi:DNA (cytosine-5)-methyltransferase 1
MRMWRSSPRRCSTLPSNGLALPGGTRRPPPPGNPPAERHLPRNYVDLSSISLFAGIGGIDLGLRPLGVRTVCFVEREAYAAGVLASRMAEGSLDDAPIWSDVSTFDGRPWRGRVGLIAGGFPCQDISNAGQRAGIVDGESSGLWREYVRIVREVGPRFVFVENVSALLVRGLDVVLGDLASLGFDAEWGVFRASDVGAPHRRERVFILAHAELDEPERWSGCGDLPSPPPPPPAREAPERERSGPGPRDGGADVAHRRSDGLQGQRAGWPTSWPAFGSHPELADADVRGRGVVGVVGVRNCIGTERGNDPDGRRRGAPWPPRPKDAAGWADYLERWPGTQPAVRRGVDGIPAGVDRLRSLGNAVVPDVATLAWRVLFDRIGDR